MNPTDFDTLTQLREWNLANEDRGAIPYGQARLIELAYSFEQATRARIAPVGFP